MCMYLIQRDLRSKLGSWTSECIICQNMLQCARGFNIDPPQFACQREKFFMSVSAYQLAVDP